LIGVFEINMTLMMTIDSRRLGAVARLIGALLL
jgi:hypothetical protein